MRKLKESDIRAAVKAHIDKKYKTQVAAAKELNISPAYISDVLNGKRSMPDVLAEDAGYQAVKHEAEWVRMPRK